MRKWIPVLFFLFIVSLIISCAAPGDFNRLRQDINKCQEVLDSKIGSLEFELAAAFETIKELDSRIESLQHPGIGLKQLRVKLLEDRISKIETCRSEELDVLTRIELAGEIIALKLEIIEIWNED